MESFCHDDAVECPQDRKANMKLTAELAISAEAGNSMSCASLDSRSTCARTEPSEFANGKLRGRTKSSKGDATCRVLRMAAGLGSDLDGFANCSTSPVHTSRSVETDTGSVDSMDTCSGGLLTHDNRDVLSENASTPPPSNSLAFPGGRKEHQIDRGCSTPFAPPRLSSQNSSASSSPLYASSKTRLSPMSPIRSPGGGCASHHMHGSSQSDHALPATSPSVRTVPELTCKTRIFYKTVLCPWYSTGRCYAGDGCNYAHELGELRAKPDLRKTRLCMAYKNRGVCKDDACVFAHGEHELQRRDSGRTMKDCDGSRESWPAEIGSIGNRRKSAKDDGGGRGGGGGRTSRAKDQRRASETKGVVEYASAHGLFAAAPSFECTRVVSLSSGGVSSEAGYPSSRGRLPTTTVSAAANTTTTTTTVGSAPHPPLITAATAAMAASVAAAIPPLTLSTSAPVFTWTYANGPQTGAPPIRPLRPASLPRFAPCQEIGARHCCAPRCSAQEAQGIAPSDCASATTSAPDSLGNQPARCFCAEVAFLHETDYESIQSITRSHGVEAGKTYMTSRLKQYCAPKAWTFFHYFSNDDLRMSAPTAYNE